MNPNPITVSLVPAFVAAITVVTLAAADRVDSPSTPTVPPVTVVSYYFGNYHPGDPRNAQMKDPAWSEWELVKAAKPRFPGHQQPKVPLWGYQDESDPNVMAQKIAAAADHGIDAFIFDWYYYDDGPFLDRPIDRGFLQATNRHRIKFALMWANHDWLEIQPYKRGTPPQLRFPGKVTPATFDRIADHVIHDYFLQPSYWRIEDRPYFSVYELTQLLDSFGSVEATRAALDRFRAKARAAGLRGLHLNAVVWGQPILPGEKKPVDPAQLVRDLGFDSVTSYVWIHHVPLPTQVTDYNLVRDEYFKYWDQAARTFPVPYFPNVTMGWDSSPRAAQEDEFGNFGYPFTNTIGNNTPENFHAALQLAKERLLAQPGGPRILNLNCWNEWTEGSYLEPDTVHQFKYLEAVRDVFKGAEVPCPLKHGQWTTFPALTDEFDATQLDESKWFPNNPGWAGRQPGYFNPKNVRLADGMLHLDAKKETLPNLPAGYHTYTTAFVKAKTKVRYGYFEIRARAMDSQASSAFWFYDITPEIWSEIDVFEIGARPQPANYYMNTHLFHTLVENVHWHKSRIWKAPYHLAREFHVYGLEWDPEVLRFTIDGAVVREEPNTHWHQPLTLCFDSETFAGWFGLPADDALPATFSIDYVRAWKRIDGPPDSRPEAVEFLFPGRTNRAESIHRLGTVEGGTLIIKASGGAERPDRVHLEYRDDSFFVAQTEPEIRKELTLKTPEGQGLSVRIAWSRTEPWKREGRERAGEAPGSPLPPINGYHAVGVELRPLIARPRGQVETFDLRSDPATPIRVTIRH